MKKVFIVIACTTICSSLFVSMTQYLSSNKSGIKALLMENVEALVSEASGESESADWQKGKALGSKEILTDWIMGYIPPYGGWMPVYETIPCCVDSIQNNACNGAGLDPRC